jgi:alcohol dehydrogenase
MNRTKPFSFYAPTRIEYGIGKVDGQLKDEVKGLGGKKLLIVTDKGIVKAGILEKVEKQLKENNLEFEVFSEVESNPRDTTVGKIADIAKKNKVDVLIAVGGGSSMDAAKAAGLLVTNGGQIHDYFGLDMVKKRALPLITIPTTAGTGSEVTFWSVIDDTRKTMHVKESIGSALICPTVALVDPLMTVSLPPHLTAYTGMDALSHAVEGYFAVPAEPITDSLCLTAIQLITSNLAPAVLNGDNLEARDSMLLGSVIAGIAFFNSDVTIDHCLGEAIGGFNDTHHGLLMGILLPYVMDYNLATNPKKFAEIAKAMGENIDGLTLREAARKSIDAVVNLSRAIGMPTLKDLNIKEQDFRVISEMAMKNVSVNSNPRKASIKDFEKILQDAYNDKFKITAK